MLFRFMLLSMMLWGIGPPLLAAEKAPAWLQRTVGLPIPQSMRESGAVVLSKECALEVSPKGQMKVSRREAVRIQTREGSSEAAARLIYNTDTQKVRNLKAWLILPSGEVKKYGKKEVVDVALVNNDVYNEARIQVILASDEAAPGSVFGYEAELEDHSVFTQFDWAFQERLPALLARFRLSLPEGWESSQAIFNHPPIEPSGSGASQVWELSNLPEIVDETMSPPLSSLAPRLALSWFPPRGNPLNGSAFADWGGVSRWLSRLNDPQAVADAQVASKAQSLTAGLGSQLEEVKAIAAYVQGIQYVSIQTGLGRGGGYTPRPAPQVFAKHYGDCKDKANLMRSMLAAVGIESYPVAIYSGDPGYVRREWPSPQQFNHAILAVQLNEAVESAAVVTHPPLGRLLLFDPTSEVTPVGALPDHLQGGLALLVHREAGGLIEVPAAAPESNALERHIEASLQADTSLTARIREVSKGQSAVDEIRLLHDHSQDGYERIIERWVSRGIPGAEVLQVETAEGEGGHFALKVNLQAAGYGQSVQGRLIIFKPVLVSRRNFVPLTDSQRCHPVALAAQAYREEARFKLPLSFAVDEQPEPLEIEQPFGTYRSACRVEGEVLVCERALTLKRATVPTEEYESVRTFFQRIRDSEQTPVVLTRN